MKVIFSILFLIFLINILIYAFRPLGEQFYIIANLFVILFSFLAFVSGAYAFKFHGLKSIQGKALFFITIGVLFWFLGETTWGLYEIAFGIRSPIASIADLFWLIGYPIFLLGLCYVCKITSIRISKTKLVILLALIIFLLTFMTYLIKPILINNEMSFAEKTITAGYVISDTILLIALLVSITYLLGGKIAKVWFIILLAIIMATVADIYYMNFLESYETGNLIDLFWNFDYILLAFGFLYHRESVKEVFRKK